MKKRDQSLKKRKITLNTSKFFIYSFKEDSSFEDHSSCKKSKTCVEDIEVEVRGVNSKEEEEEENSVFVSNLGKIRFLFASLNFSVCLSFSSFSPFLLLEMKKLGCNNFFTSYMGSI